MADLGDYLELEVVLGVGGTQSSSIAEAEALMARLGVDASRLCERAYVDLLAERVD